MSNRALLDYQRTGRDLLASAHACIMGDKPGLGKSAQAIAAAAKVRAKRILVICPAVLLANWEREFHLWWSVETADPLPPIHRADRRLTTFPQVGPAVCIVNYDKFSMRDKARRRATNQWAKLVINAKWDVIIIDEAHALKNVASNRTKAIYGDLRRSNPVDPTYWWPMSGTLLLNHAGEMYPHLAALFPGLIQTKHGKMQTLRQFEDEYCVVVNERFGGATLRVIKGSKNVAELRQMIAPVYIQRKEEDVLRDLPPLRFVDCPISIKPKTERMRQLVAEADQKLKSIIAGCRTEDEILTALRSDELALATQQHLVGFLKAEAIGDLVDWELADNPTEKRIIFLHHTKAIDTLAERLVNYGNVILDGRTPAADRVRLVDQFQNDPNTRTFIGQSVVCREGLTLTAANQVIIGEPSWTPLYNFQLGKRAARIGQSKPVLARLMYAEDTVDEILMKVIVRKTNDLAAFF